MSETWFILERSTRINKNFLLKIVSIFLFRNNLQYWLIDELNKKKEINI